MVLKTRCDDEGEAEERERDKPLQRESLQQDFSSVHMSEMMGPWLQNISSLESGFHRLPHWGL